MNTDLPKENGSNFFDVYFNDAFVGKLNIDKSMRMSFSYDDAYMEKQGEPISLTIPSSVKEHEDDVVFPFIENLLPEGEIRTLIQQQNKIEEGNFSRFIELLGGDVAGALSIQLEGETPKFERVDTLSELSQEELSQLLIDIQDRPFNVAQQKGEVGNRLSLAGAQNKLPVIRSNDLTFEAENAPSTHIIKPARKDDRFKSLVYNEYLCMKAAKLVGINTASVSLLDVTDANGNESDALLIERYDRYYYVDNSTENEGEGYTKRLQQEDLCQLCSIPSTTKYEVNGGPGFKDLFSKISELCEVPVKDDLEAFRRIIFSLVVGNYDAHAKNFSFLISEDGKIALSPAYDLVCTALYEDLDTTFAMLIGKSNDLESLTNESFEQLFTDIDKKYNTIKKQLIKFVDQSLKAISDVVAEFIEGDYYQPDIESAERILAIAKSNHHVVTKALKAH